MIIASRAFPSGYAEWLDLPAQERTWLHFKKFWLDKCRVWQAITRAAGQQGYHSANKAEGKTQESTEDELSDTAANFDLASTVARHALPKSLQQTINS